MTPLDPIAPAEQGRGLAVSFSLDGSTVLDDEENRDGGA